MKPRVLIVDDNAVNRKLLCSVLESGGFEVRPVSDADGAIGSVAEDVPDLIVMDIGLPGMDGLTLTRQFKSDQRTKAVPIVIVTASAMKGDDARSFAAGCDGYITKPIDTRTFARQIMHILANSVSQRGPVRGNAGT